MPVLLEAVPAWSLDAESNKISRSFVAKNFLAALDFFKHVGEIAEAANHHPDLHLTSYRNVEVRAHKMIVPLV
jgi:4a-hydroxytetrahydrobiopterin dehydratase